MRPGEESIELRVRRLVAETLGVCPTDLGPEVQLADDLAADSLDLVELAVEIEGEFDVTFPERVLGRIRSYGDLVEATFTLARGSRFRGLPDVFVWARMSQAAAEHRASLERAVWLTPYIAQEIAEDVLGAGRGTRLELWLPVGTDDVTFALVVERFAWLGEHGIQVSVRRGRPAGARRELPPAKTARDAAA